MGLLGPFGQATNLSNCFSSIMPQTLWNMRKHMSLLAIL